MKKFYGVVCSGRIQGKPCNAKLALNEVTAPVDPELPAVGIACPVCNSVSTYVGEPEWFDKYDAWAKGVGPKT